MRKDVAEELRGLVARMTRVGFCTAPTFSPGGERVAFLSDMSGVPQVWVVSIEGGWPRQITSLDDPVQAVYWSPGGEWLAIQAAPDGGMNRQVYLVREDGAGLRRLTDGGRDNNTLSGWTHDGKAALIASSRRDPGSVDAYLADAESGALQLVAQNPGIGSLLDVSRDGRWAVLSRMAQRGDNNLLLIDLATGAETLLTPHEGVGSFDGGLFAPDGSAVYLSSDAGRELAALAWVRLDADGRPGPIEALAERNDAELYSLAVSPEGGTLALVWNAAGRAELAFYDTASGELRPGPTLPGEVTNRAVYSQDGKHLAMAVGGSAQPTDIWTLEVASGELRQVTHAQHPGVALEEFVRPELVRFAAQDGLEITGWLYLPHGRPQPGPLVLSFHGGPEGQERPVFNHYYQALLSQGIAVLAPNVRGSSGFGKTFMGLDNGALRFDAIRDIKACAEFALNGGYAAPGQLGIMGGSYGGYMTIAGIVEYPELFAAAANLFGMVNFETFFAHTEPWMAAISKVEYGDPDTEVELLRALSPIHRIDRVKTPTLVLHGATDTNVPVVEAEQVVDSLRQRGVPVEYVLFADEGHGFVKVANRRTAVEAVAGWFGRYLSVSLRSVPHPSGLSGHLP